MAIDEWDILFLVGGIAIGGVIVYYFLKQPIQPIVQPQQIRHPPPQTVLQNEETWDMKELDDGSIRVTVHRKVKR